jgi:hypothetical protein
MRTWTRAAVRLFCGRCGEEIRRGEPVQIIQVPEGKWKLARCEKCGDGPLPALAPLQVQAAITPQRKVRSEMAGVGTLARDWKVKQAGE